MEVTFEYALKRQRERLGALRDGVELEIECLESLDKTIDSLFEWLQVDGRESLLETLCPYFGVVWPSARALSSELVSLGEARLGGRSVLELGAGLAIPSMVASKLGAGTIVATDFHPEVPRFLRRNLELNGITDVRYVKRDWQVEESEEAALAGKRFDWVIGSDILYERHQPGILARAIDEHLVQGGKVLVADPARPYLQGFVDEMKKRGFRGETRVRPAWDSGMGADREIFVVEFQRD